MKTAGLLGGMSWESSLEYYSSLNIGIKEKLGGLHSAKVVMLSVDFEEIEELQHKGEWQKLGKNLANEAKNIQNAGADFLVICTNTMHKVVSQIEEAIDIPILHIADATAEALVRDGVKKVGLLGTEFTMEQDFYKGRLKDKFGLDVLTPSKADRELVHKVIYNELCLGVTKEASKLEYLKIIDKLHSEGAEAVILGCTEIGLLVRAPRITLCPHNITSLSQDKALI